MRERERDRERERVCIYFDVRNTICTVVKRMIEQTNKQIDREKSETKQERISLICYFAIANFIYRC